MADSNLMACPKCPGGFRTERINTHQKGSFEEIYGTNPYEVYKDDIDAFFNDDIFRPNRYFKRKDGVSVSRGLIWVASHGHFETLTVEPMDGNQFEIAVRFDKASSRVLGGHRPHHGYSGYAICRLPFRIIGKNTGGH